MRSNTKIYMLTVIGFFIGTAQFIISGILDQVAASVGVSIATAGQLITAYALSSAILSPVLMVATNKLGVRRQLLCSLALMLAGAVLTVVAPSFGLLLFARVLLGSGNGYYVSNAYSAAAKLAPEGRGASAIANIAMGYSASMVLGVPIGRLIALSYNWRVSFAAISLCILVGMIAIARTSLPSEIGETVPLKRQLALFKNPRIALAMGTTLLVYIGYSVVNTYITPFLSALLPTAQSAITGIIFVLGIMSLIGSKAGGLLADRFGITRMLICTISVQVAAHLTAAIFAPFAAAAVVVGALLFWMMGVWSFVPPQNLKYVAIAPEASGILISLNSSAVQLGFAAGAAIGGVVVDRFSVVTLPRIGAAAAAAAVAVTVLTDVFGRAKPQNVQA